MGEMDKLVQCAPNFSEGQKLEVVGRIADAMRAVEGVKVLDYSGDIDHNRSVITFIGPPESVRKAMLTGAKTAVAEIDMTEHSGGHPRIGAIDVVPVIPLLGITMEECVLLSYEIGEDFANELKIPVYFYGNSARVAGRANLPNVRKGGLERLKGIELTGELAPDMGPSRVHPTAGASAVGARGPLIAYNVNLDTDRLDVAREIAAKIRQVRETGTLAGVRAIGVELKSRGIVQVSTNITEPDRTSMYDVYSFVEAEASRYGIRVLESELIGGLRQEAVTEVARQCLKLPTLTNERILDNWF
jgi:glutamate formiminotransferase